MSGENHNGRKSKEENPDEIGTFTCPSIKYISQLISEVKSLRSQINSISQPSLIIDNADLMHDYKISRTCAQTWRNSGMPYYKAHGKLYYKRSDVEEFIKRGRHRGF